MSEGASQMLEDLQDESLVLVPAMESLSPPTWPGARWIGSVDLEDLAQCSRFELENHHGYERARLLVRAAGAVRGFVDVPSPAGIVDRTDFEDALASLSPVPSFPPAVTNPLITVVVCTRDRTQQLRSALLTILALDYAHFDVVVVDNAPATHDTEELVRREFRDQRVRLVSEPVPGLSHARNTGLRHSSGEIVAFTDDDVVVDRSWLREIAAAFDAVPAAACVTGLVPAGELRTPTQGYFDSKVSWSRSLVPQVFSLANPPVALPKFPFSPGAFGTGANFALRRQPALRLGGFDPALGVGTPTGGGEDIDMFTRVLLEGHALVVQPAAIVWHRHRDGLEDLRIQARGYGNGLGAWMTKVMIDPRTARLALARSWGVGLEFLNRRRQITPFESQGQPIHSSLESQVERLLWLQLLAVAAGPYKYAVSRRRSALRRHVEPSAT
ncbi:glycosyltransferase family 2 protein [Pseudarthrobacter sp. NIBRBAC000502771]|uniref:glycosyltransferase family 2 protein n=1 Tax=Pseudarthrobacter sp. NIBRBAC000502771 TaxID=2590774 RepID=UPI001AF00FF9|nr:glycosyltransferase family 2 protein [Pseudarthrobacter sp. NIBRBAC000502771]